MVSVHHARDGKLVIQHRVLKAVEVLVSQANERGGEALEEKFMFIQSLPKMRVCETYK